MSPIFNANSLIKLSERTEYEAWLLEAVYKLVENELFPSWPDAVIYPVNRAKAKSFVFGSANIDLGDWRPGFLKAGAPLVFVSSFKLIDMLMEWVIEENGVTANYRFQHKLQQLAGSLVFPSVIESRLWLKERLIGLYRTIEPLRGTIIHDKHFTAVDGEIRVASSKGGVVGTPVSIGSTHIRMLARTVVSILRYVEGSWSFDDFRERVIRHDLDQILALHGLPSLGQKTPIHACVRVYSTESSPLHVDLMEIQSDLSKRYLNQDLSFDLRVLIVNSGNVVDCYLFPWSLLAANNFCWGTLNDIARYKSSIPDDVDLSHLCD